MPLSPSLSFGPDWMRPKPKSGTSQPSNLANEVILTPISQTYSVDELLKIWNLININVSKSGSQFTERFKSLEPIQNLVKQMESDRQIQAQIQSNHQQGQRVHNNNHINHSQFQKDQLTDKLNDITSNWSVEEQSALDIAGILKNVAAQSSSSPSLQSTALPASASNTSLLQRQFLPELIQPAELEWEYLDPNGNKQGPFNGINMQQWYMGGYLNDELQLHRVGEAGFYPLFQLRNSLNSADPFSIPLPPLSFQQPAPPPQLQTQSSFQFNNGLSNVFSETNFHQPAPTRLDSNSYIAQQQGFFSGVRSSSPWTNQAQPNGSANASPFLSSINLHDASIDLTGNSSVLNNSTIGNNSFDFGNNGNDEELLNRIQSAVLDDVLGEEAQKISEAKKEIIPEPEEELLEKRTKPQPVKSEAKPVPKEVKPEPKPTKSQQTPIAPWASITQNTNNKIEPRLTMSQIHDLEVEAAKEQKKSIKSIPSTPIKKSIEIPLTWATNNISVPTKSIFEIQKEEEELAKQKEKEEQERERRDMATAIAIVEANERKAATSSSLSSTNGNSWTTVVAKKPSKPVVNKPKITTTSNRISPDALRKVSAPPVQPKVSAAKPVVSKINARYEFLDWCKSTLRLNKNVNVDEVLSVLLILPTGSNESKEIIADTIYCNSSTMDGRRFANEFMTRREAVESIVNDDGLQWDDVLVSFNKNDGLLAEEDEGDFQVVKKGKRRN